MHVLTALYVIIVVLVLFGATIFVHELGHFLLARRHKLRIERFSIGFGPKIWGFTRDGVDYRVSLFPFGGYVALPQMAPLDDEARRAFSEAAVLMLREIPEVKKYKEKLQRKHGKAKALSILAHKIGRAVYYMLKRKEVFDIEKFLNKK